MFHLVCLQRIQIVPSLSGGNWEWCKTQWVTSKCSLVCAHFSFQHYHSLGKTKEQQCAAACPMDFWFPFMMRFLIRIPAIYYYTLCAWIICS